jgi:hypothetical protein
MPRSRAGFPSPVGVREENACRRLKALDESIGMGDLGARNSKSKKYRSFDDEIVHPGGIVPYQMNRNVNHD